MLDPESSHMLYIFQFFQEANQIFLGIFFSQTNTSSKVSFWYVKSFITSMSMLYSCLLLFPEEGLNTENLENKVKVKIFSVENHFSIQINMRYELFSY